MSEQWDDVRADYDRSPYGQLLGMQVLEVGGGYSRVRMRAGPDYGSFQGRVHNGVVMSLADQAFGTATNSLDPAYHYVAIQLGISLLSPILPEEELVAEGRVSHLSGGRGTCDIVVMGADERVVAKAAGTVLAIPKT